MPSPCSSPSTRDRLDGLHLVGPRSVGQAAAGLIGAGNYARMTFVPAMKQAGFGSIAAVTSSGGLSARHLAERHEVGIVAPDAAGLLALPSVDTVFILSRHDSHAELAAEALRAGKHVFVEKPLALSEDGLDLVTDALAESDGQLWVGFNRRHSEAVTRAKQALGSTGGPLVANYRVNAGRLPESHWYKDRRQGGRLLGEVCHFIDLVGWVVDDRPVRVIAFGRVSPRGCSRKTWSSPSPTRTGPWRRSPTPRAVTATTSKERLEILGRGRSVLIDDFSRLAVDGRDLKLAVPGKGHVENLREFRRGSARRWRRGCGPGRIADLDPGGPGRRGLAPDRRARGRGPVRGSMSVTLTDSGRPSGPASTPCVVTSSLSDRWRPCERRTRLPSARVHMGRCCAVSWRAHRASAGGPARVRAADLDPADRTAARPGGRESHRRRGAPRVRAALSCRAAPRLDGTARN